MSGIQNWGRKSRYAGSAMKRITGSRIINTMEIFDDGFSYNNHPDDQLGHLRGCWDNNLYGPEERSEEDNQGVPAGV